MLKAKVDASVLSDLGNFWQKPCSSIKIIRVDALIITFLQNKLEMRMRNANDAFLFVVAMKLDSVYVRLAPIFYIICRQVFFLFTS
jgi:hypothetical protein